MADYRYITYETLDEGTIARIMLNRPDARNAQQRGLLVELGDAFLEAEADDNVRVVILGGHGPMFSSGHDLGSKVMMAEFQPGPDQHPSFRDHGATPYLVAHAQAWRAQPGERRAAARRSIRSVGPMRSCACTSTPP